MVDIQGMGPVGFWWRCALAAALVGSAGMARAQEGGQPDSPGVRDDRRPEGARRLLKLFDFEEKELNPDPIPHFWYRGQDDPSVPRVRPGFPSWNQAELEYGPGQGKFGGCVRMPTKGGSTSLLLDPGVLVVLPGADYVINATIKTRHLTHARARVVARFLDAQSKVIAGSEVRPGPTVPPSDASRWRRLGKATGSASSRQMSSRRLPYISACELPRTTTRGVPGPQEWTMPPFHQAALALRSTGARTTSEYFVGTPFGGVPRRAESYRRAALCTGSNQTPAATAGRWRATANDARPQSTKPVARTSSRRLRPGPRCRSGRSMNT